MRILSALFSVLLVSSAQAAEETLIHDGEERRYLIEGDGPAPAPAIVVLHGGRGTAERVRRYGDFGLAERGWVEIYPEGLDRSWNDGRRALSGAPLREADDVGFIRALLADEIARGRVDPERIYVTGPSNGGAMTQRLVCQAPDLVAGAVVVIMNFPIGLDCPPGRAIPMIFMLGTEDPLVPFMGGPVGHGRKDRGGVMPAPDTLAFYAARNGCAGASEAMLPDVDPEDGMRVRLIGYEGCTVPLSAYVMEGAGHGWPGRSVPRVLRRMLGQSTSDISATAIIEDFFTSLATR